VSGPAIETRSLRKSFGKVLALDTLDLALEGSKCVGFLGPNGAGKTTTLKLLTDMIFPTSGECFLSGLSVQADRKRALANVGALIESPEIYPSLTPREVLRGIADIRGIPREEWQERIESVLADVRMTEWRDQRIGRFSKGMKQRINIASALLHDPEVVLLDEPSTGLDPRGMAEVRAIVRNLKKDHRLVFMSSHILSEVAEVCDEIALLDRGKLVLHDSLDNVIRRFADGRSSIDVSLARPLDSPEVSERVASIPGVESCVQRDARHLRLQFTGGIAAQERILESLVGLRIGVLSISEPENALEGIYLDQVSEAS
jgi:ABC-2 type transport system ATP-binding protein